MMDWAEELKLSIRKKTARKGRRSKSRDPVGGATTSINVTNPNQNEKEITIDITLDLQKNSTTATSDETDGSKKPPPRRISGGWADVGLLKSSKSKKGASFDDERFRSVSLAKSPVGSPPRDEIPTIPDMDDLKDEILLNEIVEPPMYAQKKKV
uniref:Intraflagellar transport protein 43 n=1 Tax=Bactrocera latifrons TaxID=174628 RepID=A0A0K8VZX1_BACLA